jgi:hypothetical protein
MAVRIFDLAIFACSSFGLSSIIFSWLSRTSLGVIYTEEFADEHGEVSQKPINNFERANVTVSGG